MHRLALALLLVVGLLPSPTRAADPRPHPPEGVAPGVPPAKAPQPSLPTYTIGALLPLTGDGAWFGKVMRAGMELAAGEIGEGFGFRFKLVVEDVHPSNHKEAVPAFTKLAVTERAIAVFTASATPTLAVLPYATRERVLLLHGGVVNPRLVGASPLLFHTRPRLALRGEAAAVWARERGVKRLAILASGEAFGTETRGRLGELWRRRGGSVVAEEGLLVDSPDLEAGLGRVLKRAPEAIVLAFSGQGWGAVAARLRDLGYRGPLLALDDAPEALLVAGPKAEGVEILTEAFARSAPGDDKTKAAVSAGGPGDGLGFAGSYREKYGADPERYAANAYEAVHLLAVALRRLPKPLEGLARGDRLRRALIEGSPYPSVYGGVVHFREDGSVVRPLALFTVTGGKPTFSRYLDPAA